MEILSLYDWPGNVRELENCIERMTVICPENIITEEYLPQEIKDAGNGSLGDKRHNEDSAGYMDLSGNLHLDEIERETVIKALKRTNWNKSEAARLLNIDRKALYNRIRKYNL